MTATAWAIKEWSATFEKWETLRIRKPLAYVKSPVGAQSTGYRLIMATPGGPEAYGVFVAMTQIAGGLQCRGIFQRDGQELSVRLISVATMVPADAVERAIKILSDPEIGWLVRADIPTDGRNAWDHDPKSADSEGTTPQRPQKSTPKTTTTAETTPETADSAHTTLHHTTSHNTTPHQDSVDAGASTPVCPPAKPEFSGRVERIYDACTWRKEKPREAKKAIVKAGKLVAARYFGDADKAFEFLMARVLAYAKSPYVASTDRQYLPLPASWFNAGRYDDPDDAWNQTRKDTTNGTVNRSGRRADGTRPGEYEEPGLLNPPVLTFPKRVTT